MGNVIIRRQGRSLSISLQAVENPCGSSKNWPQAKLTRTNPPGNFPGNLQEILPVPEQKTKANPQNFSGKYHRHLKLLREILPVPQDILQTNPRKSYQSPTKSGRTQQSFSPRIPADLLKNIEDSPPIASESPKNLTRFFMDPPMFLPCFRTEISPESKISSPKISQVRPNLNPNQGPNPQPPHRNSTETSRNLDRKSLKSNPARLQSVRNPRPIQIKSMVKSTQTTAQKGPNLGPNRPQNHPDPIRNPPKPPKTTQNHRFWPLSHLST